MARRCISANAIHFPSSIELDIRYLTLRSPQLHCAHRNPGFALCSCTALTETQVSLCAAVLRSPKPKFRSVQRYCAHRNPGFALCSGTALTETQVSLCAAVLRSPKPRFCSVQRYCTHRNKGFALCSGTALTETKVSLCAESLYSLYAVDVFTYLLTSYSFMLSLLPNYCNKKLVE